MPLSVVQKESGMLYVWSFWGYKIWRLETTCLPSLEQVPHPRNALFQHRAAPFPGKQNGTYSEFIPPPQGFNQIETYTTMSALSEEKSLYERMSVIAMEFTRCSQMYNIEINVSITRAWLESIKVATSTTMPGKLLVQTDIYTQRAHVSTFDKRHIFKPLASMSVTKSENAPYTVPWFPTPERKPSLQNGCEGLHVFPTSQIPKLQLWLQFPTPDQEKFFMGPIIQDVSTCMEHVYPQLLLFLTNKTWSIYALLQLTNPLFQMIARFDYVSPAYRGSTSPCMQPMLGTLFRRAILIYRILSSRLSGLLRFLIGTLKESWHSCWSHIQKK